MTNILVLTLAIALPLLLVALVVWFQVAWTRRKRRQMDDRAFALWFYRVYFGLSPKSGVYSSKETTIVPPESESAASASR